MVEISEKGRELLDQYWDAVIGYERMSGYINYEKAEEMALDELSSYIAALESENARLKDAQRWIPVGEKPLEAGTFFVLLKNGEVTKDWTFIDGGRYYWWNHGANITHYMPLPTPPEATHDR